MNDEITWEKANPFAHREHSHELVLTTEPNAAQLREEIEKDFGFDEGTLHLATQVEHLDQEISEANPLYVFISHEQDMHLPKVQAVADAHTPVQPKADEFLQTAKAACLEGETLNTKQISAVLKSLLGG